ncbi:MAG: hypothetical protein ACT4PO_16515 [Actinomycetota bacterium]
MAQTTWQAIADRIVNRLGTVANIGRVYNRTRLVGSQKDIEEIATSEVGGEDRLRVWMVHLEAPAKGASWEASGTAQWNRLAVIEGFLQLEDEASSEHQAIALGELVIRALNTDVWNTRLNSTVQGGGPAAFAGRAGEPRFFGFVVAHYVRIELPLFTIETL